MSICPIDPRSAWETMFCRFGHSTLRPLRIFNEGLTGAHLDPTVRFLHVPVPETRPPEDQMEDACGMEMDGCMFWGGVWPLKVATRWPVRVWNRFLAANLEMAKLGTSRAFIPLPRTQRARDKDQDRMK